MKSPFLLLVSSWPGQSLAKARFPGGITLLMVLVSTFAVKCFANNPPGSENDVVTAITICSSEQMATIDGDCTYSEEPAGYRLKDYRAPVPQSLTGAATLTTTELETLLASDKTKRPLLIDVLPKSRKPDSWPKDQVWLPEPHMTIPSAHWLPDIGFGTINELVETGLKAFIRERTDNNHGHPVVVFCQPNCWISWNAARRLLQYGYHNVYWYPEGVGGWSGNLNSTEVTLPVNLGQP